MNETWTELKRAQLIELLGCDHDAMGPWAVRDLQCLAGAALAELDRRSRDDDPDAETERRIEEETRKIDDAMERIV